MRGDAIHGGAQAGRGADLLRQADHGIGHGRYGGIQRLAHAAQRLAQIQGQGIVDGVAGVAQGGLQQAGGDGIDRVVGIGTAGVGGVRAAGVGRNIRARQAGGPVAATTTAASRQCASQGSCHDGGGQNTLNAVCFNLRLHDELLGLDGPGKETARYATTCINRANIFQCL
ncbi:hypothetical protein D3C72_1238300 [compost metagenome]